MSQNNNIHPEIEKTLRYERRKAAIQAVTSAEYEAEIKEIVDELGI